MKKILLLALSTVLLHVAPAQKSKNNPTVSDKDSLLYQSTKFRLIGPFRGGRSAAVYGSVHNKSLFYFGSTGGGVWKTQDGGSNWTNISDGFFGGSIGMVAVAPSDETIIYAGEGEMTMRGNVSEGLGGLWRSEDAGRSWHNLGLKDARHIVDIAIHPKDPDIAWVAVMGHLFGPNKTRGIYKTTDGGRNWKQVLYVNDQTGCSDIMMEPGNPQTLYAGTWRVIRTPFSMESGGDGSALWKSTDGGETWKNISARKGLPKGNWGIVCVAVSASNPNKVYAMVENEKGGLFVSTDAGDTWTLASNDNNIRQRAWYYSRVFVDPSNENLVYCPNVNLMVSKDAGKTFTSIRVPHGDTHDLWIDPSDGNRMIVADDGGAQISYDGGKNWSTYLNQPTVQVYRLSTDNAFPYRVLGAQQDNSAFRIRSQTYGRAITEEDFEATAGGESGYIVADPTNPDITYGGSYMGYLERLNHKTGESKLLNIWPVDNIGAGADVAKYRFQWNYPMFFSPHNSKRLYAAGNHLFVTENEGKSWDIISPDLTTNDKSKQGASGGIITKDNTGVEYYCTIFTAAESALEKDLLWTGSDDGLIHISKDGGKNWTNVTPANLPSAMMWNCVEVDPFKKGAAYFAGTRYKSDDFTPFLYKTEDYGKTWKRIDAGIDRMHFTRAIRADQKKQGILYAGTEYGLYISYNDGASWQKFQLNLPDVPVTDIAIKNNDLIVGTQGRSIYILDDLSVVQQREQFNTNKNLQVFAPDATYRMPPAGGYGANNNIPNSGTNPPKGIAIPYWLKSVDDSTKLKVVVMDQAGKEIQTFSSTETKEKKLDINAGMNNFVWNLQYERATKPEEGMIIWNSSAMSPLAIPGKYTAKFVTGKDSVEVPFTVLADPNYKVSQAEYQEQFDFLLAARDKFSAIMQGMKDISDLRKQMDDYCKRLGDKCSKEIKDTIASINKKMKAVEESLHQTKAKSGQDILNFPIQLDDKLSGIYSVASYGNGAPSEQVRLAYAEIAGQVDEQLTKLENIKKTDIAILNEMIHEKELPVILPKPAEK